MKDPWIGGIVIVAAGLFSVVAAVKDWDWFMNHRKARFFVSVLGRQGARMFYGILGAALAGLGVALGTGLLR